MDTPTNRTTPRLRPIALGLKLRQQALKLGLTPGSDRWRAYVLGTAKRERKAKMARKIAKPLILRELCQKQPQKPAL